MWTELYARLGCASLLLTDCIFPNVSACCLCCCLSGQRNLYFSLPAIVGWLGTAFLHAALIVIMVLLGADSLDSDSGSGHTWSLLRNGLLMFTIVIITVHLQLAMVIDQWTWIHHVAIWGSIGEWACNLLSTGIGTGNRQEAADVYKLLTAAYSCSRLWELDGHAAVSVGCRLLNSSFG